MVDMNNQTKLLFTAFVAIIIGVVLIGAIGDEVSVVSLASATIINESATSGATITLANDELISFDELRNLTTQNVATSECNATLATGILTCNSTILESTVNIDYKFTPDTFVRGQTSRTLLNITILLFAIAIIAIGIGFALMSFKVSGVM